MACYVPDWRQGGATREGLFEIGAAMPDCGDIKRLPENTTQQNFCAIRFSGSLFIGLGCGLLLRLGAVFFFGNEADFAQTGLAHGAEGFFYVVELGVFIGGDGNHLVGIGFGQLLQPAF